jgi:hypothetical protein
MQRSAVGDVIGRMGALECTSCHNPHGTNYRILNDAGTE